MKFLSELRDGETVTIHLVVKKKYGLRQYRNRLGVYFVLAAGDKTGTVLVKFWGVDDRDTERIYREIEEGDVIEVHGTFQQDMRPSISVDGEYGYIKKISSFDPSRFIPSSDRIEENYQELMRILEEVEEPHLANLLDLFFQDEEFVEKFKEAPWSSSEVYSYLGGLLEHTLHVALLCRDMAKIYGLNRDLILTAAALHDVGKIEAYEISSGIIQRSEAKLLGHTVIGYSMVESRSR